MKRGLRGCGQPGFAPVALGRQRTASCALLGDSGFFALRFQFSELLRRQKSFGVTEKCLAAFLRAACLHALRLPRVDLGLLNRREIQRGQINAFH